jgi:rubrerythrin
MPRWTEDDIAWSDFDPEKLTPDHLKLVRAASLTEYNAARYTQYLKNVFAGDGDFAALISEWQREEEQHGAVLGRYAEMADPDYDFAATFSRFQQGYVIPVDVAQSIRGSRVGELLARCVVETGTSSFYTALGEAVDEPVLKAICNLIVADEFRHYRMFLEAMRKHQPIERLSLIGRLKVALGRVRESDDDELAFAYHCANEPGIDYDLKRSNTAYGALAYRLYQIHHVQRMVAMVFKATGLDPQGWLSRRVARWAWKKMQSRALRTAV